MIYVVPIEPLEERYSSQWREWFYRFFTTKNVSHTFIDGIPLTSTIERGAFLDVCGTNYYKASQLMQICKLVHEGSIKEDDIFLFMDLWFPGLEMLAYMKYALDLKFRITGMLHAGTYDENDFLTKHNMGIWGKPLEESWFTFVNAIFVATKYHKRLLEDARQCFSNSIYVTGFPIYPDFVSRNFKKENIIIFPHRLDREKRPDKFDKLKYALQCKYPNWQFIKSKEVCKTKHEYYNLLERAKVAISFAEQETWGIAMQEALFCGCIPIVPDRLSYEEMYPKCFRYYNFSTSTNSAVSLVEWAMKEYDIIKRTSWETTKDELEMKGRNALDSIFYHLLR
jgi:glycosyltransferase involved in cell wall biosynthesis